MSKFEQINTFIQVAESASFRAAARTLKISSAAVSKQISLLEDSLKAQLLYRSTRRVELSELGKIYFEQYKRIMNEIREADALISQTQEDPFGLLRITSARHFGERYIVPYLAEFMKTFPKVVLNLELAERVPDLEKENIDILLGNSIPASGDVIQRVIGKTRYVLAASPVYLRNFGIPKRPQDLVHHRYITHSMRQPDDMLIFKNNETIRVEPVLRLNDTHAMLQSAISGIGIVKLHEYVVHEALIQKKLVEILPLFADDLSIFLCYQARRYVQPKIRRFIDFILEKMAPDT